MGEKRENVGDTLSKESDEALEKSLMEFDEMLDKCVSHFGCVFHIFFLVRFFISSPSKNAEPLLPFFSVNRSFSTAIYFWRRLNGVIPY